MYKRHMLRAPKKMYQSYPRATTPKTCHSTMIYTSARYTVVVTVHRLRPKTPAAPAPPADTCYCMRQREIFCTACYWLQRCCLQRCQYPTPPLPTNRVSSYALSSVARIYQRGKSEQQCTAVCSAARIASGRRGENMKNTNHEDTTPRPHCLSK